MEGSGTLGKVLGVLMMLVYLAVMGLAIAVFYEFGWNRQEMAFNVLFIWVVMPVTGFIASFIMGRVNSFGWAKWIFPVAIGVLYMLVEYITFGMSNNAAARTVNPPEWTMIIVGGVVALIGMMIGSGMRMKKAHDKAKKIEKTATRELPELQQLKNLEPAAPAQAAPVAPVLEVEPSPEDIITPEMPAADFAQEAADVNFVELPQDQIPQAAAEPVSEPPKKKRFGLF